MLMSWQGVVESVGKIVCKAIRDSAESIKLDLDLRDKDVIAIQVKDDGTGSSAAGPEVEQQLVNYIHNWSSKLPYVGMSFRTSTSEETFVRCYEVTKEDGQPHSFKGPHLIAKPGDFSGSHTRIVLPNVWVGLGKAHLGHSLLAEIQMVSISALQATALYFRSMEGDKQPGISWMMPADGSINTCLTNALTTILRTTCAAPDTAFKLNQDAFALGQATSRGGHWIAHAGIALQQSTPLHPSPAPEKIASMDSKGLPQLHCFLNGERLASGSHLHNALRGLDWSNYGLRYEEAMKRDEARHDMRRRTVQDVLHTMVVHMCPSTMSQKKEAKALAPAYQEVLVRSALSDALQNLKSRPSNRHLLCSVREASLARAIPSLATILEELALLDGAETGLYKDVWALFQHFPGESLESKLQSALSNAQPALAREE